MSRPRRMRLFGGVWLPVLALLVFAPSAPAALQWLSPENISPPGQGAFNPQVASTPDGTAFAIWARMDGTAPLPDECCSRIQFAVRPPGGSYGAVSTISAAGQSAWEPQIAVNASGDAIAVWTRFDGANSRIQAAFRPAGGNFGTAQTLSISGRDAFEPQVSIDPEGNSVAIWTRSFGARTRIETSTRPAGGTFAPALALSEVGQDAFEPRVAAEPEGEAVGVWTRFDGTNLRIQAADLRDAPGYPRPQGASILRVPLAIAYQPCGDNETPNRRHGPALEHPSCNPALQASTFLTVGSDATGKTPQFVGSQQMNVVCNPSSCADAGDQADLRLQLSLTDVRKRTDLSDYDGELRASFTVRITDKFSGSLQTDPATVSDTDLGFAVPCTATGGTADVGSTCSVTTHLDSVTPGAVVEGKRAIWELGAVEVLDGGADGLAGTAPNTPFARQGLFAP